MNKQNLLPKKSYFLIFAAVLGISFGRATYSMGNFTSKICTAAQLAIALKPAAIYGASLYVNKTMMPKDKSAFYFLEENYVGDSEESKESKISQDYPHTTNIVSTIAQKYAIPCPHISVTKKTNWCEFLGITCPASLTIFSPGSLLLLKEDAQCIEDYENNPTAATPESKKLYQEKVATLHHELTHVKNRDGFWHSIASIAIPIASIITLKKIPFIAKATTGSLGKNLLKIPVGLAALLTSSIAMTIDNCRREFRADDSAKYDKELLNANIRDFQNDTEKKNRLYQEAIDETSGWRKQVLTILKNNHAIGEVLGDHPSNKARIARMQKHLVLLEQKEANKNS